ncbi:MAG: SufD family Fe-S cluster assembly protein [Bacteroidales bacterium]|nr:SufD family Fe-S cluster assembly protein [Bacteroidales bacterium]
MMNFGLTQSDFARFSDHVITQVSPDNFNFTAGNNDGVRRVFLSLTAQSISRKNSLILGDNSDSEFIYIILFGNDDDITQDIDTKIVIGNNSKLSLYVFCAGTSGSAVNHNISFKIGSDTNVMFSNAVITGKSINTNLNVDINGENSTFDSPAILMPWQGESFGFKSVINHNVPRSTSRQIVRAVVDGNGVSDFYGLIKVAQDSQKTETFQVNNNILLSENAHALSKPQLEIYADDVKCSHGSTTGMLDKEALFYMRSRGISEPTAQNLLIEAFIQEIVDKIEPQDYKHYVEEQIAEKLRLRE